MPSRRRLIQLYAALLHNAHLKGFISGEIYTGSLKSVCLPGLNCYSCPGAATACPLGSLQNALAASNVRAPWYILGILLLSGLIFGRTICGFLCPFGLVQDLLHKLPTPKVPKSRFTRILSYLKYILLIVFVIGLPLLYAPQLPLPAFCKYICPAGTLEGAVGLLSHPGNASLFGMLGSLFTWKFVLLVGIVTACIFIYRAFCRFLCPLGAIYGLFSRLSLLGIEVEASACTRCGHCVAACPVDIKEVGDHECIHCGRCKGACPTQAIHWKAYKPFRFFQTRRGKRIALALALLLLVGVIFFVSQPTAAPTGSQVGMRCPDFSVPLYNGETYHLADSRGKVTVLNFWATWCGPCIAELPYFEQLHNAYGDQVDVLAIHSNLVTEDVPAWLSRQSYTLPFALDETGSVIASLGGSTMLPMTVILDQEGVIVYNAVGSVDYAFLEGQIQPLLDR